MKKIIPFIATLVVTVLVISCKKDITIDKPVDKTIDKLIVAKVASYIEGIVEMHVSLGQKVQKGQILFKISTDCIEIAQRKAENEVWFYKNEYSRIKKLNLTHSQSLENLEEAKYNLDNSIGKLKTQELFLKWSKYYAPFNGIVTNIYNYTGSGSPSSSGNDLNSNAVLEVTKLDDNNKGMINVAPAIAQVASMKDGLLKLSINQGEKVNKGQLLFTVSAAYDKITRAKQQARLLYYKQKFERSRKLFNNNSQSLKVYQSTQYNFKNAIQDLKSTDLMINKNSTYYAPFDGIVTNINHYTGSNIFVGHRVLEITKH